MYGLDLVTALAPAPYMVDVQLGPHEGPITVGVGAASDLRHLFK